MMHRNVVSSAPWMFVGNTSQQILQFVTFILLARQLAPDIFGQVALAAVVIDIALAVGSWGLPQFLTQRGILSRKLAAHAFVLSLGLAFFLCVLIAGGVGIYTLFGDFTLIPQLILLMMPIIVLRDVARVPTFWILFFSFPPFSFFFDSSFGFVASVRVTFTFT